MTSSVVPSDVSVREVTSVPAMTSVQEAEVVAPEGKGASAPVLMLHPFLVQQFRRPLPVDGERPAVPRYRVHEVRVVVLHVNARCVGCHARRANLRRVRESLRQTWASVIRNQTTG